MSWERRTIVVKNSEKMLIRLKREVERAKVVLDELLVAFIETSKALESDGEDIAALDLIIPITKVQFMGRDFEEIQKAIP